MKNRSILTLAAASLAITPMAAQAAEAPASRQSAPASDASSLDGSPTLFFLAAIVGVAVGIFLLIDDDDAVSA